MPLPTLSTRAATHRPRAIDLAVDDHLRPPLLPPRTLTVLATSLCSRCALQAVAEDAEEEGCGKSSGGDG